MWAMNVTSEEWDVFCELKALYLPHVIATIDAVSTMMNESKR